MATFTHMETQNWVIVRLQVLVMKILLQVIQVSILKSLSYARCNNVLTNLWFTYQNQLAILLFADLSFDLEDLLIAPTSNHSFHPFESRLQALCFMLQKSPRPMVRTFNHQ